MTMMMLMGYTWAACGRTHPEHMARLVEQEGVHGIITAGKHAKRDVHGNEDQGQDKATIFASGRLDAISIMGESIGRSILDAGYLRVPCCGPRRTLWPI